ncbi:MAG TPA: HAD-IC family P-type ATPase [Acidimicrobiales bacterium]|jgi:cation-transporting ATPase E
MAALPGLTAAEVAARVDRGEHNRVRSTTSRTVGDIIRANVLTRFNAILGSLLVVILVVGPAQDATFGVVLVLNIVIGVVQEVRSKLALDRLAVVVAPVIRVHRDGAVRELDPSDLVLDDVFDVAMGEQIPVDAVVLDASGLEVDESLLSGESEAVERVAGEGLLSGSVVVAGSGTVRAVAVGEDAYAHRLAGEARRFELVGSELRAGTDTILRGVTWLIVPTAVLLVWSQLNADQSLREALRGSVAAVGSMVPEGLILLTSVAFAVAALRLTRRRVLIQELASVEALARVDVICVDKTGTLTQGRLSEVDLVPVGDGDLEGAGRALGALGAADPRPNASLAAVAAAHSDPGWHADEVVAFSSARRWSGADFGPDGCWLLGAPDVLAPAGSPARTDGEAFAAEGHRVLLLGTMAALPSTQPSAADPPRPEPVALVVLDEALREDAADTVAFFQEQGVRLVVLSGDHAATVGAVARRVGVEAGDAVDASALADDPGAIDEALAEASVFGRVDPYRKRAFVASLHRSGHVVAMTGDGVNDVLALRDADIGVAMGSGTPASRAVARVVLLDDSWSALPNVVAEGRRVIANIERVACLFVTKTVYATLLALIVGVAGVPFPFYPRHLTIISSLTIGIPAFFLALEPNTRRATPGFLRRVLLFAVPAGFTAAAATYAGYAIAGRAADVSLVEERTSATIVLFLVAMWVLSILARPLNGPRSLLLGSMAAAFVLLLLSPAMRTYFALDIPPLPVLLAEFGVAGLAAVALEAGWQGARRVVGPDVLASLGSPADPNRRTHA